LENMVLNQHDLVLVDTGSERKTVSPYCECPRTRMPGANHSFDGGGPARDWTWKRCRQAADYLIKGALASR